MQIQHHSRVRKTNFTDFQTTFRWTQFYLQTFPRIRRCSTSDDLNPSFRTEPSHWRLNGSCLAVLTALFTIKIKIVFKVFFEIFTAALEQDVNSRIIRLCPNAAGSTKKYLKIRLPVIFFKKIIKHSTGVNQLSSYWWFSKSRCMKKLNENLRKIKLQSRKTYDVKYILSTIEVFYF